MRLLLAILIGKLISKITRTLKIGGGTAAPGLYALKIYPELVEGLVQKIPKNVVITGTNGKTTTARMLAHFARESGLKVIRNHTGSNLERGIVSTLISNAHLKGANVFHLPGGLAWHMSFDLGIWELDEAAFNSVVPKIKPDIVVFLNVFRDQLDRYGEVDSVVKRWCETLTFLAPQTIILVNGDDVNTNKLKNYFKGETYKFGVQGYKIVGESIKHLKEKESLDFQAIEVKFNGLSGTNFRTVLHSKAYSTNLLLPGVYHIYDFLAAFAVGHELGFSTSTMISSLKTYSPAFGRVEKFSLQPGRLHRKYDGYIFLIKNPAGATQVFETIAPHIKQNDRLLLALNDNIADGTDISWIWDAQFENLKSQMSNVKCICSGTRAYDMANRLKYAGFDAKDIIVESDLKKALEQVKVGLKGRIFILPTYTAMLELQKILAKMGVKRHYWEEAL